MTMQDLIWETHHPGKVKWINRKKEIETHFIGSSVHC